MDNVVIRTLNHDDLESLIEIRVEALAYHPNYFGETVEQAKSLTKEDWLRRISSVTNQSFGLFDNGKLIGITGVFIEDSGDCAKLVMSYIKSEYRGRGLSNLFYKERINWALGKSNIKYINVSHRKGNSPSRKAIIKHGFKFVGTEETDWPDGSMDTEYKYQIDLRDVSESN